MKTELLLSNPAHFNVVVHVARTYHTFAERMEVLGRYFPDTAPDTLASALYCIGNGATWDQRVDVYAYGFRFTDRPLLPPEQERVDAFRAAQGVDPVAERERREEPFGAPQRGPQSFVGLTDEDRAIFRDIGPAMVQGRYQKADRISATNMYLYARLTADGHSFHAAYGAWVRDQGRA